MCGLAGMIGFGIQTADLECFQDLLYMSALRGPHSTGVAAADLRRSHVAKGTIKKQVGPASLFIFEDLNGKKPLLKSFMNDVFIGHCRWSTVGVTNEENAHPFDTGRYIGAHNGTLHDKWSYHKTKTDSELMFEEMEKRGIDDVLSNLELTSAYAVSILDKTSKKLYLARNFLRTLYVAINQKRGVLYWASEHGFLTAATDRRDIDVEIFKLEANTLYEIDITDVKAGNDIPWVTYNVESPWKDPVVKKGKGVKKKDKVLLSSSSNISPWDVALDEFDKESTELGLKKEEVSEPEYEDGVECCICNKTLTHDEWSKSTAIEIEQAWYFSCQGCDAEVKDMMRLRA